MNKPLDCEIVRDLLPSYVDGLTSDMTKNAVEEHLASCADCSAALRRMREPEPQETSPAVEVDYLKKVRRRSTGRSLVIAIILMLLGMSILGYRYFYVGRSTDPASVACRVSVDGNTVNVSGTLTSSALAVSRVTFSDSSGMVRFKVYTAPKAFFNSGDFTASYTAASPVGQVRADDLIVWESGVEIGQMASRLFSATNPYVGDMPSNGRVANILGVSDQFGPYTNELQTDTEPYGWTLILQLPIESAQERTAQDIMAADSCAMLAVIENLGYVTWQYDTGAGAREYTVTAEDASALAGGDIKGFAASAPELQKLTQSLSFKWSGVRDASVDAGVFTLTIRNESGTDIYGLGVDYYLNGELAGSRGARNADNSPLASGAEISYDFTSEDLPGDANSIEMQGFSFDLSVIDRDGAETVVRKNVPLSAKYGWAYTYAITGDPETGFMLSEG